MKDKLLGGFYLGDLLVEPSKGRVSGGGREAHLSPVGAEVLLLLASQPGEVVGRSELLQKAWGPDRGSNEALSRAVGDIRQALGDRADNPVFIQTLPRYGYRLLLSPVPLETAEDAGGGDVSLFQDLRQRGVIETGLAYLVTGWVIIQIADVVFDQLLLPQWAGTFVTVLVIAGFPVALLLAWLFEFRDGRAVLDTKPGLRGSRHRVGRAYLSIFGAMVIAGIAVFAYDRFVGLPEDAPQPRSFEIVETDFEIDDRSVGVLRFLNIDGSERTQIFADGFAEDLIHRLAAVPGLSVAARGDAWTLPPNSPSDTVRQRLRVAYYLEGSVRLVGDTIRVVVQLIDSDSGFHVVSRSYDRELEDFMQVQREVTELAVANLRVALPETPTYYGESYDEADIDAYVLYRRAEEILNRPRTEGTLGAAISLYEQSLDIDPDFAAAHAGICKARITMFELATDVGEIEKAESACGTALAANPNLYVVHTALGNLYLSTGRLAESERAFQRSLNINPNDAQAMLGLAVVYSRTQRFADAEALYRQAIDSQPGNWMAINQLGGFLFEMGRYEEAAEQYAHVAAIDKDNFEALGNMGAVLIMAGEFERAQAALTSSIEVQPTSTTYSNLAATYYYIGEFDEAVGLHEQAVKLGEGSPVYWVNLGDALYFAGEHEKAADAFREAASLAETRLSVDGTDAYALYMLSWSHMMLGDTDLALDTLDRGLAAAPRNPYGYYYQALIDVRLGRRDAAREAVENALKAGFPVELLRAEPYLVPLREDGTLGPLLDSASR